jgi:hypothetical protein
VKPDITFFGESLPARFMKLVANDFAKCDALIVMGTSLLVQPVASLIDRVPRSAIRVLINREPAGECTDRGALRSARAATNEANARRALANTIGFAFDVPKYPRDIFWRGDCDQGAILLSEEAGWGDVLFREQDAAGADVNPAAAAAAAAVAASPSATPATSSSHEDTNVDANAAPTSPL